MSEYPDINKVDELVAAIAQMQVLGGLSRSYSMDPNTGDMEPDRYIERVIDYLSEHALRSALERAFSNSHYVAGVDGIIIASSRDELTLSYADGTKAIFIRQQPTEGSRRDD